jgi:DNA-binding NarL/FixJ family response regulator
MRGDDAFDPAVRPLWRPVVQVVLAERQPLFRSAVAAVLAREPEFDVVQAADLEELLAAASNAQLALVDLELPPAGGFEALARLRTEQPSLRLVAWGDARDLRGSEAVLYALEQGADGYLHKQVTPGALVAELREVVRGYAPLPRELVPDLLARLRRASERERAQLRTRHLSARETDVLRLVAAGYSNSRIASELAISLFTVKRHVQNILAKLDLPSRRHAALLYTTAHSPR